MAFTPVEIIALVVIIASAIKILVLAVDARAWLTFAKNIYSNPTVVAIIGFVLAAIVLNYLLSELTIVQIVATVAFTALMLMIGLAHDVGPLIKKYETLAKQGNVLRKYWFYTLIWVALMVWAALEIFI